MLQEVDEQDPKMSVTWFRLAPIRQKQKAQQHWSCVKTWGSWTILYVTCLSLRVEQATIHHLKEDSLSYLLIKNIFRNLNSTKSADLHTNISHSISVCITLYDITASSHSILYFLGIHGARMSLFHNLKLKRRKIDTRSSSDGKSGMGSQIFPDL